MSLSQSISTKQIWVYILIKTIIPFQTTKMDFEQTLVDFHFLLGISFLCHTEISSLLELYNNIRGQSLFIAFHPHFNAPHLHIITTEKLASKGQKIQSMMAKICRKIPWKSENSITAFKNLLKLCVREIKEEERNNLANAIISNGAQTNCVDPSKPTRFSTLCRNRMVDINENRPFPLTCLATFGPETIFNTDIPVEAFRFETKTMEFEENLNSSLQPMDEITSDSDEEEEQTLRKKKVLTKMEKWDLLGKLC